MVLIGCIPLGLDVACEPGSFIAKGRIWFIPFRIGKRGGKDAESGIKKTYDSLCRRVSERRNLKILLENGYTILCRLVSRVRVMYLKLHYTAAGSDPANVAVLYGAAGIALEGLSGVCDERVPETDLHVDADFEGERPRFSGRICLTMRTYQALYMAVCFGWGVLRDYQKLK